jgi:hypothetical protein
MISNERQWPHLRQPRQTNRQDNRQPYHQPYGQKYGQQPPRPFVQEDTLKTGEVQIERKFFVLTLKENLRGRFLRITEEVGGKRNSILIPSTGLADFQNLLEEMAKASDAIPIKSEPTAE